VGTLAAAVTLATPTPATPDAAPVAAGGAAAPESATPALRAALQDAASAEAPRHQHLLAELQTPAYLESLDSPADYAEAARLGLHVGHILDALARNPAPSAQRALRALTASKTFLAHDERAIALIRASANVRPASTDWVRFWDRYSRPDDGFTPTTIGVLVDNGSEPALRLLEQKLADPHHGDDDKRAWMHREVLRHRNDPPLLQASGRLLKGRLPNRLRSALVETLFDYRPGEWFKPGYGVSAPPLAAASASARVELRRVGNLALHSVALTASQRAAVTQRMQELDAAKDAAQGGGPG
jgi:hypothetical protein